MPGRSWTVEAHPKKAQIVKALLKGEAHRSISERWGIPRASLSRYLTSKLVEQAAKVRQGKAEEADLTIKGQVAYVMERMRRLYDACDEYLRDPANPEKYDLGPRAWEIDVVYRTVEPDTDKMITRKESLDTLLRKLDQEGYQPWEVRFKQEDPRRLIIGTANAIAKQLELLGKLEGSIQEKVEVNLTVNQVWLDLKQIVLDATEGHPDIQRRLLEELARHG